MKALIHNLAFNWPVLFRAGLYFAAVFLGTMVDRVVPILEKNEWPSGPRVAAAVLVGLYAGIVTVRAFYDGSAERHGRKVVSQ